MPNAMDEWTEMETNCKTKLALHVLHKTEGSIDQSQYPLGSSAVGLFVDCATAFHEHMVKHNVTVTMPPTKQPWYDDVCCLF